MQLKEVHLAEEIWHLNEKSPHNIEKAASCDKL